MTDIDIHNQILNAAENRFQVYGFNKTTMAEIASDVDMSAANLYRYFKNKLDIGAALAECCLSDKEALLTQVVDDSDLNSSDKLIKFVYTTLDYTYTYCEQKPKMNELVQAITMQRPEVENKHRTRTLSMLAQLLEEGKQRDEFVFDDLAMTAESIDTACILFCHPMLMTTHTREDLEVKLLHLCQLLINGLKK